ncbi:Pentatricopeptide repeat-containing protein [Heracleum sosnowskyi]|uniref:Pentatricopeptide repeat-containing protein n=1 Tax=Heracleum sosnowskyi TaxID=360622 RepID=A0AAD8MPJ4_9APIA|nr:Pentatricopeptide repeat-containing protein [Heracleum sosnowskyi]
MGFSQLLHRATTTLQKSNLFNQNPKNTLFHPHKISRNYTKINEISVKSPPLTDTNTQNPDQKSPKIIQESEKIIKIVMTHHQNYKDSNFNSALDSTNIKLSPLLVLEVLKKLNNAGVLALNFFKWAEKKSGYKHTTETYNCLIESLGRIRQFKMIWVLVNEMKQKGVLSKDTFLMISRRYSRAKKVKESVEAFERMERFGFKAELSDYNRFLDCLCKSGNVDRAHELFDKWKKRTIEADVKTYTVLLEGWGKEQNLLRLNEVFREMKSDGLKPDVVTYGIVVHAYCKAKKNDEAIELFREMERNGVKGTPHMYCTLINGLGNEKRLIEALEFFEESKDSGLAPEAPTYNAVVGAFCWSMQMYDAYRMVDEMRKCGIGPNSRTYDIILHHLVKARRVEEAYDIFQKMSNEPLCKPVLSTYEIIVRMFCNEGRLDMAMSIWDQMKANSVLPGMHMYSTLINSLCHENKLDDACKYFEEMMDMGIRPPVHMFSNLKDFLLENGRKGTVLALSQKLDNLRNTGLVS